MLQVRSRAQDQREKRRLQEFVAPLLPDDAPGDASSGVTAAVERSELVLSELDAAGQQQPTQEYVRFTSDYHHPALFPRPRP